MRNNVLDVATECDALMADGDTPETLSSLAFALKLNNSKMASSELVVEIVHEALRICGVAGSKLRRGVEATFRPSVPLGGFIQPELLTNWVRS